jgi:hypothetical protein
MQAAGIYEMVRSSQTIKQTIKQPIVASTRTADDV